MILSLGQDWADAGVFGRLARNWPAATDLREPAE